MEKGFKNLDDYYKTIYDFHKAYYEKKYVIPNWVYLVGLFIGFILTTQNWLGLFLIGVSLYQLTKRSGEKEGWVSGFNDCIETQECIEKEGGNLKSQMVEIINLLEKKPR